MSHLVYCYYYSIKVVHNKQIHSFVYLIQSEGRKEITGFENMMGQRNMIDGWVCKNVNEISHYMQKVRTISNHRIAYIFVTIFFVGSMLMFDHVNKSMEKIFVE